MDRHRPTTEHLVAAWKVDSELHGHSPSQVLGFWADVSDLADGVYDPRSHAKLLPAGRKSRRWQVWRRRR
jgi:hypothetical protein